VSEARGEGARGGGERGKRIFQRKHHIRDTGTGEDRRQERIMERQKDKDRRIQRAEKAIYARNSDANWLT
jgi:hypothetical protein